MADKDKKKLRNDLKQEAKDAEAKKTVNERMRDVYDQAKKLEAFEGITVKMVPVDETIMGSKSEEKTVPSDTVKANVTTVIKRKEVTR